MNSSKSLCDMPRCLATAAIPDIFVAFFDEEVTGWDASTGCACCRALSSELSSNSVESPSSAPCGRGIPRTGRSLLFPGSSSSLESANRLVKTCGRASSSPSEFANRVVRTDLGGDLVNFALGGAFLLVEKNEYRSPPVGPRRVLRMVPFEEPDERGRCSRGDSLCSVGDWTRTLALAVPALIVRRIEW